MGNSGDKKLHQNPAHPPTSNSSKMAQTTNLDHYESSFLMNKHLNELYTNTHTM